MKYRSFFICIVLFLFQVAAEAKIYGPKRYDSVGLLTYVSTDFYSTNENFDSNSSVAGLNSGHSYLLIDIPFGIRYAIAPLWSFEAELKASYAQSKSSDVFTGGERTNSEINEARFSTDMLVETNGFDLIPEFEVIFPLKKNSASTDTVMINEGVQQMTGKLHLQTEFGQSDFFSYIGYQIRDSGRSDLVPWSVGMGWNRQGSLLGFRVFGFQSISDDTDKANPFTREALNNKVNGGSLKFYSVNPSVISTEALWFFKLQKQWQFQFNLGLDLAGQRYSKGLFGGLNLVLDWGEKQRSLRQRPRKEIQQPQGSGFAIEPETIDFKEDTNESSDQNYFKPPPAPRVRELRSTPIRKKSRTRVSPSDQQIQEQMDDVEMQIELKRKKK